MYKLLLFAMIMLVGSVNGNQVKIRNHTNEDIEIDIDTSGALGKKNKTVKAKSRRDFDIHADWLNEIKVKTKNGKRKGSAGPGKCSGKFYKVDTAKNKTKKYQYGCKKVGGLGQAGSVFFDVFMPSSSDYIVDDHDKTKTTQPVKDKGDNLIIVRRFENIKY